MILNTTRANGFTASSAYFNLIPSLSCHVLRRNGRVLPTVYAAVLFESRDTGCVDASNWRVLNNV
jgi:hypothetical protein